MKASLCISKRHPYCSRTLDLQVKQCVFQFPTTFFDPGMFVLLYTVYTHNTQLYIADFSSVEESGFQVNKENFYCSQTTAMKHVRKIPGSQIQR